MWYSSSGWPKNLLTSYRFYFVRFYYTLPRDVAVRKTTRRETKRVRSDMMFWRLLHDKHIPWPCIVNSLKKNFASTCLCFHSGNHKSITLGRQTCVPRFMCGMVVWWELECTFCSMIPWQISLTCWLTSSFSGVIDMESSESLQNADMYLKNRHSVLC